MVNKGIFQNMPVLFLGIVIRKSQGGFMKYEYGATYHGFDLPWRTLLNNLTIAGFLYENIDGGGAWHIQQA